MPGSRYHIRLLPLIAENTRNIPAGPLVLGVEYRVLNVETLREAFKDDPETLARAGGGKADIGEDRGVSIHVCGAEGGEEYLRFDCFNDEPHYHYYNPVEVWQDRVDLDPIADGEILDWTIERLRSRLPEMLRHVGAHALADRVDPAAIEAALPELVATAQELSRMGAPAPVAVAR
jgi:hypothetical protein